MGAQANINSRAYFCGNKPALDHRQQTIAISDGLAHSERVAVERSLIQRLRAFGVDRVLYTPTHSLNGRGDLHAKAFVGN